MLSADTAKSETVVMDDDYEDDEAGDNLSPEDDEADGDNLSMSSSSFTGTTVSTTRNGHEAKQVEAEKGMRDKIIKKEEKAVRKARIIVIAAFLACATAVSVAVYIFASRADYRSFELEVRE
jgi:hypothetical protein